MSADPFRPRWPTCRRRPPPIPRPTPRPAPGSSTRATRSTSASPTCPTPSSPERTRPGAGARRANRVHGLRRLGPARLPVPQPRHRWCWRAMPGSTRATRWARKPAPPASIHYVIQGRGSTQAGDERVEWAAAMSSSCPAAGSPTARAIRRCSGPSRTPRTWPSSIPVRRPGTTRRPASFTTRPRKSAARSN